MATDAKNTTTQFVVIVLVVALVVAVAFLLHILFSRAISDLTVEIMAAVLGVVLVVASVGVTIHFQNEAEKKRQFQIEVFQTKLKLYKELLDCITASDDDDHIGVEEIEQMRNKSSVLALVASEELLGVLAKFIGRVTREGQLKPKEDQEKELGTYRHIIQEMRKDLAVVEGDVSSQVRLLIAEDW